MVLIFIFEDLGLVGWAGLAIEPQGPACLPVPVLGDYKGTPPHLAFFSHECWGHELKPRAFITSTLWTEPSSQPPVMVFTCTEVCASCRRHVIDRCFYLPHFFGWVLQRAMNSLAHFAKAPLCVRCKGQGHSSHQSGLPHGSESPPSATDKCLPAF